MLELREITKKYHFFPAVNKVSFKVKPGEILGYLGPNGAGKTTTLWILTGLLQPTEGQVYFQGRKIKKDLYSYKKRIGYVPEEAGIYPYMSAYEYLMMVGRLRRIPEKVLKKKTEQFLELFQLSSEMHLSISSFSKGMIQKVILSAALLHDPDILYLDEPLSGLDVTTGLIVKDLLQRLAEEGKIIVYSSHILEVVEKICHRVIIIYKGKIVADDSVANLRELMKLPSLEDIFNQLVIQEDTQEIARGMVEAMKSKS